MEPVRVREDLYWVGAIDWGVRDFHGYVIEKGTTYNNYLLLDRDITLFDAVHKDFSDYSIENIRKLVEPQRIRNFVINHIEPDHAGSLLSFLKMMPDVTVYVTERGRRGLQRMFGLEGIKFNVVKTGDSLNLGKYNLIFIETPMLHWPDSMVTYIKELKTLISQDAFGFHFASSCRFDDEFVKTYSVSELEDAVYDYYANILMPFGNLVKEKIEELMRMGIEIEVIAPDHGIIWRKEAKKVLKMYLDLAESKAETGVVIVYDTMWGTTEHMVFPIMSGIIDEGVKCKTIKLRSTPSSQVIKEIAKLNGFLVGTPTINNSMFPSVAEFLHHLYGLKPKKRMAGAFGSYGWSGGGVREVYDILKRMGLETMEPGVEVNYGLSYDDEKRCYEFGRTFAKKLKEFQNNP